MNCKSSTVSHYMYASSGQPDPDIGIDPITQECKWLNYTEYERAFLNVPIPELLHLIKAADNLDVRSLYQCACQAIAARIKGKEPAEMRELLQQYGDLSREEIGKVLDEHPWLNRATGDVLVCLFIPCLVHTMDHA